MKRPLRRLLSAAACAAAAAVLVALCPAIRAAQAPADPQITLRIIVVSSEDAAQRVVDRLNKGESFALLAKTLSTAPSANEGGWLGRQSLAQLRPEVRTALQGLHPGQLAPVVRIPTGFAIFKVEADDPADDGGGAVNPALAASGAVRFVYDLSGFTEARTALEAIEKPADWNLDPKAVCSARTQSIASTRASIEAYLSPKNAKALATQTPVDLMQLYFGLGQLESYEGRMAAAVGRFQDAARIVTKEPPAVTLPLEEALGIALLHKSDMDNDIQAHPGDRCLLGVRPAAPLAETADAAAAIQHFETYLRERPGDLEVMWLLNLAYMAIGRHPQGVPPPYLIPASSFTPREDIGRFRDVAPEAGLAHVGSAGGLIVDDFRGNGRLDIVTSMMESCGTLRMFGNNGDGTFTDRTAQAGLTGLLGGLNIISGDYNNDGCPDILVLRGGWEYLPQRMTLLRNSCTGTFTDVTLASGLASPRTTQTAVWTDIDNDGYLDLFAGNETGPAQLFRNRHDGTFEDISHAAGIDRSSFTKGVAAADYDNDRYPDLYVSNYGGANFLYHNNRNGTFTEVSAAARVAGTPTGFGTWFFDYDNDGLTDLFVTSYVASVDEYVRSLLGKPRNATTMKLYRNLGDGTFRDVSADVGLTRVQMPMGSNFGDVDNDGFLDMYLGTGQPSYAATVGSMLLHNEQGRRFVDVAVTSGTAELHKGHGVAFADLDNDGDEDIVFEVGGATPGDRHAMRVFENPGHGNDWIALKLVGTKTNRSAVGARIKVTVEDANGQTRAIYRTVTTGGSFGASPLLQHIGLGRAAKVSDVEVWWPTSDTRQHFAGLATNQWFEIQELSDHVTTLSRAPVRLGGPSKQP